MTKQVSPALVLLMLTAGCGGGTPTGPSDIPTPSRPAVAQPVDVAVTPVTPVPAVVPHGANGTDATKLCAGVVQGVSCLVLKYNRVPVLSATVRVTNEGTGAQWFNLTSYKKYTNGFEQQVKYDEGSDRVQLQPGASTEVSVTSFECSAQIDAYLGDEVNHPPHPAGTLIGYESTGAPLCTDPKPPVTPPTPPPPKPPPPPPVDVCPNLEGNQATVPDGDALIDGLCVPQQPPVVCPTIDATNWYRYIVKRHVDGTCLPTARATFLIKHLPDGCHVDMSLVCYVLPKDWNSWSRKFPQLFYGGTNESFMGNGERTIETSKPISSVQCDLRVGGFLEEPLTDQNEASDYGARTVDWLVTKPGTVCQE